MNAHRSVRAPARAVAAAAVAVVAAGILAPAAAQDGGSKAARLLPAPVVPVPPLLDRAKVDHALAGLDGIVERAMAETGVPGVAVAVVHDDEVLYQKGFGVREVGRPEPVDTDTVFLLASVSKPLASTIVARLVGEGRFAWDDPVRDYNSDFRLSDPYVTANATFADLMSHRSGLATGAGDLLEDLGFDRATILSKFDQQPLDAFRSSYHYSNFGYTAGGEAAAVAAGMPWEDLADALLFEPLGMASASYRHADYLARDNKALIHVRVGDPAGKVWEAKYDRDPDAEAPAGGASASIADLAKFVRLQLANGVFDGGRIVDEAALAATHVPQVISGAPSSPAARGQFYGLGWNVGYDDEGRARVGHSGAFNLGTSTNVTMLPGERLGIAVITNGEPIGVAEAIAAAFLDAAQHGEETVDWLPFLGAIFEAMVAAEQAGAASDTEVADPAPARAADAYAGVYDNGYYGPLTVTADDGGLSMTMGPEAAPTTLALTHVDGDRFVFETIGENAYGLSNARFEAGRDGTAARLTLDFYDTSGLGTFTRR